MTTISAEFLSKLQAVPTEMVGVIITVSSNAKAHAPQVEQLGLIVSHTYSLRPMIAANGPAQAIIALAQEAWVEKIEPDGEVRAI